MTPAEVIRRTYEAYNARDLQAGLAGLDPSVVWDTGQGSTVQGKAAVAQHWRTQWEQADAKVRIDRLEGAAPRFVLAVTLETRDADGHKADRQVTNTVTCDGDLIREMRIS